MYPTVIIPTYNEAENLPRLVSALFALPISDLHILVIDDNSPDGTGAIAAGLAESHRDRLTVMHRPGKLGLGSAYTCGFHQALKNGAGAVVQMDADFSHAPEKLLALLDRLQECDLAMGSRYVPGGSVDERWPFWRKALSAFGNTYARTILGLTVRDATGGFRAWRREALLGIPLERVRSNGYAFQVETVYLAHLLGYQIMEVPIYFADRRWGQSKMSFQIQREAAIRVWQMLYDYRGLRKPG